MKIHVADKTIPSLASLQRCEQDVLDRRQRHPISRANVSKKRVDASSTSCVSSSSQDQTREVSMCVCVCVCV
jgi:hypothetical protein